MWVTRARSIRPPYQYLRSRAALPMRGILFSIAVAASSMFASKSFGAVLEHKCVRMMLPFTPKTDMGGGALWVINADVPRSKSPFLIIAALCSDPQNSRIDEAKGEMRRKFTEDEAKIKPLCIDAVDQRVIQHRPSFIERRFACTQTWSAVGEAPNRGFGASSLIELDGHMLVVAYGDTAPREAAEKQFDMIIGSLSSLSGERR